MLLAVRPARKARRGRPAEATPRPGPPPEREARSVPAPTSGHVRRYRGVNRPQPRPSPTAGRTRQHWQRPGFAALKQHDRSQLRGFTHQVPLAWRGHTSAPRRAGREVHVGPGPPATRVCSARRSRTGRLCPRTSGTRSDGAQAVPLPADATQAGFRWLSRSSAPHTRQPAPGRQYVG